MGHDVSPLREGAIAAHELYLEYVRAGFTQTQALHLVAAVVAGAMNKGGQS